MNPPSAPLFLIAGVVLLLSFLLLRKVVVFGSARVAVSAFLLPCLLFAVCLWRIEEATALQMAMITISCGPLMWSLRSFIYPVSVSGNAAFDRMLMVHQPAIFDHRDIALLRSRGEHNHEPKVSRINDSVKCAFFDFAPVILVAVNSNGVVVMTNRHFQQLLRQPFERIVGKRWFEDLMPFDGMDYHVDVFNRCLDSGHEHSFGSSIMDGDQRKRVIRWKCGVAVIDGERVVLYCGEDVTEHESEHIQLVKTVDNLNRLTEDLENRVRERTQDLEMTNRNLELHLDERDVIERQLVSSERLHMAMAHNFPNGIIAVLDQHLRFVLVDGRELKPLGYSSATLTGKYIYAEEFGLHPEAVDALRSAFKGDATLVEVTFKGVFYNLTAVPLPDHQNQIDKILVVFQNISQHKKLEQSLYSSIDQERKLNELKSRFLAMASHEFRTPLSTILSSVFLLENYNGEMYEQNKHHHIERIKRTINMLTESLNDFLRLGKLEEGRIKLILTDTCVKEYVAEIVKEIQTVMKAGQEIQYVHEGIDLHVLLDRNLTRGILLNLLSNAGKYSSEKAVVFLATALSEERLFIRVTDTGLGIPAEEHKHVFDRFFRGVNALHIEGTGLGLHIVKKYVELMNGSIDFKSDDTGTTFTVEIPLKRTQDSTRLILH